MMKTNTVGSLEVRIHFVESWELSPFQKAQVFFAMFEKATPDDQRKLAHAAVKYAANTNYNLFRRYLLNSRLPRPVLSVFMTDTLKRTQELADRAGGGAKPSGAGGGDVALAFFADPESAERFVTSCSASGLEVLSMALGAEGVRSESETVP